MTMNPSNEYRQLSAVSGQLLQIIGIVLIVGVLLDYFVLAIPPNFLDKQWEVRYIGVLVDRGIVPLVALGFLLLGSWLQQGTGKRPGKALQDSKFWGLCLSVLLGLIFLLAAPLHFSSVQSLQQNGLVAVQNRSRAYQQQIEQGLNQAQSQLQQRQQQGGNAPISPDQLNDRAKQALFNVRTQQQQAEEALKTQATQSIRITLSSLLLGVGYSVIGWSGLVGLGYLGGKR